MIYFIYGNQGPTVKSQIRKIGESFLNGEKPDDLNFIKLDGNNFLVQDAIDECQYVALGYEKKVVSLENCYFLLKPKPKNKLDSDQDYDKLLSFIKSGGIEESLLILSVTSSSIDEKSSLIKALKEKAKVVEITDPDEKGWNEYVKAIATKKGINIDRDALTELANRTSGDVGLFTNSLKVLTLYTDHIRYEDVCLMVTKPLEDNAFMLFNLLLDGKNGEAINLFRDLRVNNVEPVTLISQLSNQFRLLNQIYYLNKKRYSKEDIASELKIKPGRVFILSRFLPLLSESTLHKTLEDLYNLDLDIKSGQVDRYYAFEMFLLKFKTQ